MNRFSVALVSVLLFSGMLFVCSCFSADFPEVEMKIKSIPTDWNITLVWSVPDAMRSYTVMLVRKEAGYPESTTDGTVIYTGFGDTAVDKNLVADTKYFYRFFFLDANGNISGWARHKEKT
jgi:hypothetical protein